MTELQFQPSSYLQVAVVQTTSDLITKVKERGITNLQVDISLPLKLIPTYYMCMYKHICSINTHKTGPWHTHICTWVTLSMECISRCTVVSKLRWVMMEPLSELPLSFCSGSFQNRHLCQVWIIFSWHWKSYFQQSHVAGPSFLRPQRKRHNPSQFTQSGKWTKFKATSYHLYILSPKSHNFLIQSLKEKHLSKDEWEEMARDTSCWYKSTFLYLL